MRRVFSKEIFHYSLDRAFRLVITACAGTPRKDQDGTWITTDMIEAYIRLHELGIAHSIEVWDDGGLAGGLYGLSLGGMFFGESMFSRVTNASKAAFITLAKILQREGFDCLDCQLPTPHLESLGADREDYLELLQWSLRRADMRGSWSDMVDQDRKSTI
jgi:leucyl/phenylalanyl-tRNA--protein transferase